MEYLDALHHEFDKAILWTRNYHLGLEEKLLGVHLRFGIFRKDGETSLLASRSPDFESDVKGYFSEWPKMHDALLSTPTSAAGINIPMEESGTRGTLEQFYFESWFTMLFRACCWGACHEFLPAKGCFRSGGGVSYLSTSANTDCWGDFFGLFWNLFFFFTCLGDIWRADLAPPAWLYFVSAGQELRQGYWTPEY
jgi:hypothetical protein